MAPLKSRVKHRARRATTPFSTAVTQIKSASTRELMKKQRIRKRTTKHKTATHPISPPHLKLKLFIDKNVRERWMQIAKETQMIVLGDGQYVEERRVPIVSCALAQRIEGFGQNPLGQVDPSAIVKVAHDISAQVQRSCLGTIFYPHQSELLADWASRPPTIPPFSHKLRYEFTRQSTLEAARHLLQHIPAISSTVGVLSFASRKGPGGGYLHGGDDQEERIARLSSLVTSLSSPVAKEFYSEHHLSWTQDGSGFYDNSMVFSPGVVVFREDRDSKDSTDPLGGAFISPYLVDVLSVVPVNAAVVRSRYFSVSERTYDDAVRRSMKERMARSLRVFEEQGNRHLVLGAFGCSSSENKLDIVAGIWAELLVCGDMEGEGGSKRPARFKDSFDSIVFAVPGKSFKVFRKAFELRLFEADLIDTLTSD